MKHLNKINIRSKAAAFVDSHIISYRTGSSLNNSWSFGALLGVMLILQILSGILICFHYSATEKEAFDSVILYTRNGTYGWFVRYLHANGASVFFILVYLHIGKAFFYGSYFKPRHFVWFVGIIMFLIMMATAFLGYVLPWGQMSFWGATVITNLFTSIPEIGDELVTLMWGGFSVSGPTLQKFFGLHFALPWILLLLTFLHLALLHAASSTTPSGAEKSNLLAFHPFFGLKDLQAIIGLLLFLTIVITYYPNAMGHPDNYIPANPMVTPKHIVPEWYFLPFYAILRSIPNKQGGVLAMAGAILVLFVLPFFNSSLIRNTYYRPYYSWMLGFFFVDFIALGWIGQNPVEAPYDIVGLLLTVYYFVFLLVIIPLMGYLEHKMINVNSTSVLNTYIENISIKDFNTLKKKQCRITKHTVFW